MTATNLAGINLGQIDTETMKKEAQLNVYPLYGNNSNNTDVTDFGGVTRTITVSGVFADTTANMRTFLNSMEALIQGQQDLDSGYPKNYYSEFRDTTYKVKIFNFSYDYVKGVPGMITYNFSLVEASQNC